MLLSLSLASAMLAAMLSLAASPVAAMLMMAQAMLAARLLLAAVPTMLAVTAAARQDGSQPSSEPLMSQHPRVEAALQVPWRVQLTLRATQCRSAVVAW